MDSYTIVSYRDEQYVSYGWGDNTTIFSHFEIKINIDEKELESFLCDEFVSYKDYKANYADKVVAQDIWLIRNGEEIVSKCPLNLLGEFVEDPCILNIIKNAEDTANREMIRKEQEKAYKKQLEDKKKCEEDRERDLRELERLKNKLGVI
jgi:hypothetical protein